MTNGADMQSLIYKASQGSWAGRADRIIVALRAAGRLLEPGRVAVPAEAVDVLRTAHALARVWVDTEDFPGVEMDAMCDAVDRLPAGFLDGINRQETTA
jgi:hypothetical protein